MSTLAAELPRIGSGPAFGTDASGDDARGISERFASLLLMWDTETPQSLPTSYSQGIEELEEAFAEASTPNWDGEGAYPASDLSKLFAKRLLASLPSHIPAPMVVVSAHGTAVFEWAPRPRHRLSIEITGAGALNYACTRNAEQYARVESFSGTEMPPALAGTILDFF